jgi:hypothetical protein
VSRLRIQAQTDRMRTRENGREEHMMAIIKQLKLVVACVMLIILRESIVHADNDDDVKESYVQLSRHRTSLQGKELRVATGHVRQFTLFHESRYINILLFLFLKIYIFPSIFLKIL